MRSRVDHAPSTRPVGSQAERTHLAWLRTLMAFFVNGGLLLLRRDLDTPTNLQVGAAIFSFALGLSLMLVYARWDRVLTVPPPPTAARSSGPVLLVTLATFLVGIAILSVALFEVPWRLPSTATPQLIH